MDWRWIAVVTSAGTSIGLIALGAYAMAAANDLEPKRLEPKKYDSAPSLISTLDATSVAETPSSSLRPGSAFAVRAVRPSSVIVTSDDPRLAGREGVEPSRLSSEATHETNALGYFGGPSAPEDAMIHLAAAPESQLMLHGRTLAVPGDRSGLSKLRHDCARPLWDIAKVNSPGRLNASQARYCPAFEPASTERGRHEIAMRRFGEERAPAKVALILGIAF
jgi:hypothetical protein